MKLYLKGVRAAFPHLFEPYASKPTDKAKFSIANIIEKDTLGFAGDMNPDSAPGKAAGLKWTNPKEAFSKAIIEVAKAKWGDKAMAMVQEFKAQNRLPLHDGAEKPRITGYAGNLFCNASNEVRPVVRNKNGAQLDAKDGVIYAGCYVDVVLDIWAQANQYGQRINASLLSVTFNRDGDRLAGGVSVSDDDYGEIPAEQQAAAASSGDGAKSLF